MIAFNLLDPQRPTATAWLPHRVGQVLLAIANLVPLAGVVWWGWDAFALLVLYWAETAVAGFWAVVDLASVDLAVRRRDPAAATAPSGAGIAVRTLMIVVHAAIFMAVHMVFLWSLFSGPWAARIHGASDFIRVLILDAGLWLPLAAFFIASGVRTIDRLVNRLVFRRCTGALETGDEADLAAGISRVFYRRIVLMQLALIAGGWFAKTIGTIAPLVILIAGKTLADLPAARREDRRSDGR